MILVRSFWGSK